MLLFPTTHLREAERRAERILQRGVECHDQQLLSELWCALRNAESAQESRAMRVRLHRIIEEVDNAIAEIEREFTVDSAAGAKRRFRSSSLSTRRRAELERARQRKMRD